MKRFISALVALAMILSMVPAVFATESGSSLTLGENVLTLTAWDWDGETYDSWSYTASEAGTLTLSVTSIMAANYETGEMESAEPENFEQTLSAYLYFEVFKNDNKLSCDSLVTNTVEVAEGDVITVGMLNGFVVPAEVTINLAFEASEAATEVTGDGSFSTPYVLPGVGDYQFNSNSIVYWQYTTPISGKLTVTMTGDTWYYFNLENKTSGSNSDYIYAKNGVNTYTIDMYAGDSLTGIISPATGADTVSFTMSFEECEVDRAVSIPANWSFEGAVVTVDPGSRLKCMVSFSCNDAKLYIKGENFYVEIDEQPYEPENGKLILPFESDYSTVHTVYLYNTGDEAANYTFGFDYFLGTQNNPEDLTNTDLGDFTCTMPDSGYYYGWTAPESGKFTITMLDEENWVYTIENLTTGEYYSYPSMNWVTYEEVRIPSVTMEVSEGDVIRIELEREDWTAGQLNFNVSFVAGAVEKYVPMTADPDELPLTSVEVAPGASIRYDIESWLDGGKLTITGVNDGFYVVVGGTGVYNAETGLFMPEGGTKYDPVDGVVKISLPDYEVTVVHIVNKGAEAATYVFDCEYPTGTRVNPDMITESGSVTLAEDSNPYYFAYLATGNGYINVGILATMGLCYNIYTVPSDPDGDGIYGPEMKVENASEGVVFSIPVFEGDQVYIVVNNWDVDDSVPNGKIDVSVSFEEVEHTGYIKCGWSGDVVVDDDNIFEVPANGDALYMLSGFDEGLALITGENFYVMVNGEKLYPEDGSVTVPFGTIMIHIVNTSSEPITLEANVDYPLGNLKNPDELTMGSHSITPAGSYEYYWFTYEPAESGVLTLTMVGTGWFFDVNQSWEFINSEAGNVHEIEVLAGEIYEIRFFNATGSTIAFTASFEAGEIGGGNDGEHEYLGNGEELFNGDNFVEVEADSEYGSEWYYVPTMTGNLTLSITDLLCLVDGEWGELGLSALGNGLRPSSVVMRVNGTQVLYNVDNETASITIPVTVGTRVEITMASANGTGLRATFTLACESNLHEVTDGNLVDGNNQFTTVKGETSDFTYTATADGKLVIELISGGYWELGLYGDEFIWKSFQPAEMLALFDPDYSYMKLTVNGEVYVPDYSVENVYLVDMDVKKGDVITLSFTNNFLVDLILSVAVSIEGGETGAAVIEEIPTELSVNFATIGEATDDGMVWQYIAAQNGTLEFFAIAEGLEIVVLVNGEWAYSYYEGEHDGAAVVKEGDTVEIWLYATDAGAYSCFVAYAEPMLGDVDGNGIINIMDANLVCSHYNELLVLTDAQQVAADVDGNGIVNIMDANLICSYYNELISDFEF